MQEEKEIEKVKATNKDEAKQTDTKQEVVGCTIASTLAAFQPHVHFDADCKAFPTSPAG